MKLYMQYLEADTLQDLVRLEHSLEWLGKDSPYKPALPLVISLRSFIKQDLEAKVKESAEDPEKAPISFVQPVQAS